MKIIIDNGKGRKVPENDRLRFRAWHKPTKRLFKVWSFTPKHIFEDTPDGSTYIGNFDDCVLEQCTGLKDVNGRLIYEGDIVKCNLSKNPGVIKWDQEMGALRLIIPPKPLFNSSLDDAVEFDFKVIGNIHENKNLLKEEEK